MKSRFWWLRFCSCHVDQYMGRFHDHYCPRRSLRERKTYEFGSKKHLAWLREHKEPACEFCQGRPWQLFNGIVDDTSPVKCPECGRSSDAR